MFRSRPNCCFLIGLCCCFFVALPAYCRLSRLSDVPEAEAGTQDSNVRTVVDRFSLVLPLSSNPADPWTIVQAAHFDFSAGSLPAMTASAAAFPAEQKENSAPSKGSSGPAIKPAGSNRQHHPHLIELTSNNWQPLKPGEKFELFWRDMFSWETHLSLGIDGAIAFATDDRDYLGDGFQGWAKRYGINVLDEANFTLLEAFVFPSIFHTEPRYIPMNTGTTRRRLGYAVSRVVVARKDSGGYTFNAAKVCGVFTAAALSNAYNSPARDTPNLAETFARAAISMASDSAFNIFKEFWPDFARKVKLNVWIANIVRSSIRDVIQVN